MVETFDGSGRNDGSTMMAKEKLRAEKFQMRLIEEKKMDKSNNNGCRK